MTDKHPGIDDNSKKALAESLNGVLADSYALYLKTKNFHWHMHGPHFRDYHLLLDEQAAEIIGTTDAIAERVRKIGLRTLTSIGSISRHQSLKDSDDAGLSAEQMLDDLRTDNLAYIAKLKEAKALCEETGDNATDGLIDDWTDMAEERAWFLASTLEKN
ncbi:MULTISPECIES: Dps family protein [Novosphingopyxis]|uniref:Dps family protein n=1 Tax=Novosphingopyxis TaxID=2709686 RepID=UPI000C6355AA|nr:MULTISPECIES: DNA starvation/stationary phase protection protein [Novosphingopyxis]MAC11730.1 DNA starvation/stationary phase protection protein [Sphingorhabdus sp.]MBH9536617.1 DNA starvation/stationary phase protection protein [Novosphingopyxis sp. YJ-S2-01]